MTKYQKETLKYSLEEEKKILNNLKKDYKEAGKTIEGRIKKLMGREDADLPHVIHQVKYQKALKNQIDDVLDKLNDGTYSSIQKYMEDSYGTGFTSSLYRLQKQGVPLTFPIDREEMIRAVQTNSKISKKKYGKNFTKMKNTIRNEVTRGISSSMSFGDIARNIDNRMKVGLNASYRIARTEGHRINQEASFDVMHKAKEAGADVVKKWDSTLDSRTRSHHSQLDGQIREIDEPFEVAGKQAMYPSGFGRPEEDINCRCVVLEIGRWELDEDEGFTKNVDGEIVEFKNLKDYEDFKERYYAKNEKPKIEKTKTEKTKVEKSKTEETKVEKIKENDNKVKVDDIPEPKNERKYDNKVAKFIGDDNYDDLRDKVENCENQNLSEIWNYYEDDLSFKKAKSGEVSAFSRFDEKIHFNEDDLQEQFSNGVKYSEKNQAVFHEAGHNIDYLLGGKNKAVYYSESYNNGAFPKMITKEVNDKLDEINKALKDEFDAHLDDLEWLRKNNYISESSVKFFKKNPDLIKTSVKFDKNRAYSVFSNEIKSLGLDYNANLGDIIEGATYGKVHTQFGHGADYWTKRKLGDLNVGLAREAFAEMIDSTFSNPKQLETIKKYLPKSYQMFEDMIYNAVGGLK